MSAPSVREPQRSRAAWHSIDVADPAGWTFAFNDDERDEIIDATKRAVDAGKTVESLRIDDFVLASLGEKAIAWSGALDTGLGFVLLRRFPTDRLDPASLELAYVGLGLHFGDPVGQDAQATMLGHVRDEGRARTDPSVRIYRTRERQDFHTDGADLVGLLCLHTAASGGQSRIASSLAVYNEMLRRRPDLVEVLYEPLCWDRNDEQSVGDDPYFSLPVFSDVNGAPRTFYIGWYIRDAQRHPQVPRLTRDQLEAMELLEAIANDPAFYVEMNFEPGDIQLLNNAKILHSREAYEDSEVPGEQRHLLRLWLSARHFAGVEAMLRSGIPQRR